MLNSCQPCDGITPWTSMNCCTLRLLWDQHQGSAVLTNASAAEQARGGKLTSSQQIIFTQERSGQGTKAGRVCFQITDCILLSCVISMPGNQPPMILVPFSLIYTSISNGRCRPAAQEASGIRSAPLRQRWPNARA